MTVAEAAKILNITERAVRKKYTNGELSGYKKGRKIHVDAKEVYELKALKEQELTDNVSSISLKQKQKKIEVEKKEQELRKLKRENDIAEKNLIEINKVELFTHEVFSSLSHTLEQMVEKWCLKLSLTAEQRSQILKDYNEELEKFCNKFEEKIIET